MDDVNLGPAEVVTESARAILVRLHDSDFEEVWVPKSVISDDSECYSAKSPDGDLIVAGWWAREHGYV